MFFATKNFELSKIADDIVAINVNSEGLKSLLEPVKKDSEKALKWFVNEGTIINIEKFQAISSSEENKMLGNLNLSNIVRSANRS